MMTAREDTQITFDNDGERFRMGVEASRAETVEEFASQLDSAMK
jgi:hypothetical protein